MVRGALLSLAVACACLPSRTYHRGRRALEDSRQHSCAYHVSASLAPEPLTLPSAFLVRPTRVTSQPSLCGRLIACDGLCLVRRAGRHWKARVPSDTCSMALFGGILCPRARIARIGRMGNAVDGGGMCPHCQACHTHRPRPS
ncbi:hypothetical protein QBC46DRAFT_391027 [Diplogelasinospora grovesii]|uniref:Secreted protein n=1 Tax=Diplogelasinospora grovesii TaxID=303347 RepID=A0AAN6N5B7_9PEZI|nr:hypothetical protein QBC46DRAFT_391027 [Diplogelasinospora grovesii]